MSIYSPHRAVLLRPLLACLLFLLLINRLMMPCNSAFAATALPDPIRYELNIKFNPATSSLSGMAIISLKTKQAVTLDVESLHVKSLFLDGVPWQGRLVGAKQLTLPKACRIKISWSARFNDSYDHGIFPGTIVLTDDWFPAIKGMARYRLRASLPLGYLAVSAGDTVTLQHTGGRNIITFDFPHPLPGEEGLGFAATNRYQMGEEQADGVLIRTLLTKDMAEYANPLMEQAKILLTRYQKLFGPYPFKRLTFAEAPTSCSLSYPGYILLTRSNIKGLPEDRTLAHGIVHEWFGNSVFISWKTGNWAEGAAIYFADHGFEEGANNGWRCRRKMLRGVIVRTVSPPRDFPGYRIGGYRRLRSAQGSQRGRRMDGIGITDSELADRSLAIMGRDHPVVHRLFGQMPPVLQEVPTRGFCVTVLKNPLNPKQVVAIFDSSDRDETRRGMEHVENYGGYSSVVFSGGALVSKSVADGARGIDLPILFEANER